jgi:hypothetical protein
MFPLNPGSFRFSPLSTLLLRHGYGGQRKTQRDFATNPSSLRYASASNTNKNEQVVSLRAKA